MLTSRDYIDGDYEKYIHTLTKANMEALFVANFGGWSDSVSREKFFDVLSNGYVRLFFLSDAFIGYVTFNPERDFSDSYLIDDLHVVDEHQRKGYGSLILEHVIKKAKIEGVVQLRVFVFRSNPSLEFYRKHGFEEVEFLKKSNTYVMRRKI